MKKITKFFYISPLIIGFVCFLNIKNSNNLHHPTKHSTINVKKKKSDVFLNNNNISSSAKTYNNINKILERKKSNDILNKNTANVYIQNPINLNYTYTIYYWAYNFSEELTQYSYTADNSTQKHLLTGDSKKFQGVAVGKFFDIKVHINALNQPTIGLNLFSRYKNLIVLQELTSSKSDTYYYINAVGILTCPNISMYEHNMNKMSNFKIGEYNVYNFYNSTGEWSIPLMSIITPIILLKLFQIAAISTSIIIAMNHWDKLSEIFLSEYIFKNDNLNYFNNKSKITDNSKKQLSNMSNNDNHFSPSTNHNVFDSNNEKKSFIKSFDNGDNDYSESQQIYCYEEIKYSWTSEWDNSVVGMGNYDLQVNDWTSRGYSEDSIYDIRKLFIIGASDIDNNWERDIKIDCLKMILPNLNFIEFKFQFFTSSQSECMFLKYSKNLNYSLTKRGELYNLFKKVKNNFYSTITQKDDEWINENVLLQNEIKMEQKWLKSRIENTLKKVVINNNSEASKITSRNEEVQLTQNPPQCTCVSPLDAYKNKLFQYSIRRNAYLQKKLSWINAKLNLTNNCLKNVYLLRIFTKNAFSEHLSYFSLYLEAYNKWFIDFDEDGSWCEILRDQFPNEFNNDEWIYALNNAKKNAALIVSEERIKTIRIFLSDSHKNPIDHMLEEMELFKQELINASISTQQELRGHDIRIAEYKKMYLQESKSSNNFWALQTTNSIIWETDAENDY